MTDTKMVLFSYGNLPDDLATEAMEAADRIRGRLDRQKKNYIEIGRDLIAVKEKLGHGHFGNWLKAEFDTDERTVQNYMRAAKWVDGKSESVSDLPINAIYELSAPSTPVAIQEKVLSELDAGRRVTRDEIRRMVKLDKEEDRRKKEEARETPRQRKSREQKKAEEEQRHLRIEREDRARERAAGELVSFLLDRLGDDIPKFCDLMDKGAGWRIQDRIRAKIAGAAE
jgi:hypothetical protein